MEITTTIWAATIGAIALLIVLDFVTVSRKPHDVMFKEALGWSVFYIAIALAFGVWVWSRWGSTFGSEYFAAYLVEKSLSVDNLFVFVIILTQFAVPSIYHQRVLLVGVVLALVFRAIFIAIGAAALAAFSFTFVIFGAILIWTGIGLFRHRDADPNPQDNIVVRTVRRAIPITDDYHGTKLFIRMDGRRLATPLFLVMIAIGATDLLFALDSIPATFGVTQEPYLVFAANAFALLGLRALYFLLKGLLDKLIYLSTGLAIILVFIGVKLIMLWGHELNPAIPKISTNLSLAVIATVLTVTAVASVIAVRRNPELRAHAGTVTEPRPREPEPDQS
jgi:tellurite resistance protein TerC